MTKKSFFDSEKVLKRNIILSLDGSSNLQTRKYLKVYHIDSSRVIVGVHFDKDEKYIYYYNKESWHIFDDILI